MGLLKLHGGTIFVGEDLIMRPEKSGKVRQGDMDIAGDGKESTFVSLVFSGI